MSKTRDWLLEHMDHQGDECLFWPEAQLADIRQSNKSMTALGAEYGIGRAAARRIRFGLTYKPVQF